MAASTSACSNEPASLEGNNVLHWLKLAFIAAGLGLDAMSVCIGVGVKWHGPRQRFRLAWHMGLFQFLMPILGWLAGSQLANLLRGVGSYIAAGLVVSIGGKMLYEAIHSHPGRMEEQAEQAVEHAMHLRPGDPTRGLSLMLLSLATSLDALVVGFSLGVKGEAIWQASILIGVVAGLMALAGVVVGKRLGEAFGKPAEIAGAAFLVVLGFSFLWL